MTEADLQVQVAYYLRLQYPDVIFHSDYGSGVRLTRYQANVQRKQNGGRRAYPDMFIAKMMHGKGGLFIELKKEGTKLKKKDGTWLTSHLAEQAEMLEMLKMEGYEACFGVGFDNTKAIIDSYLGGANEQKDTDDDPTSIF